MHTQTRTSIAAQAYVLLNSNEEQYTIGISPTFRTGAKTMIVAAIVADNQRKQKEVAMAVCVSRTQQLAS